MKLRVITAAAAAPLALAGVLLTTAGQASAAVAAPAVLTASVQQQGGVFATTHENGVDDTFSPPASANWAVNHPDLMDPAGGGPIWAYDNVERHVTAVPVAGQPNTWQVTVETVGEYNAFANPVTGEYPWAGQGRIHGTITWTVTAPTGFAPSKANLPAQTDPSYRSQNIVAELFGLGSDTSKLLMTGGTYSYDYYGIPGAPGGVMHQG
jgi:hypothetical protein